VRLIDALLWIRKTVWGLFFAYLNPVQTLVYECADLEFVALHIEPWG